MKKITTTLLCAILIATNCSFSSIPASHEMLLSFKINDRTLIANQTPESMQMLPVQTVGDGCLELFIFWADLMFLYLKVGDHPAAPYINKAADIVFNALMGCITRSILD